MKTSFLMLLILVFCSLTLLADRKISTSEIVNYLSKRDLSNEQKIDLSEEFANQSETLYLSDEEYDKLFEILKNCDLSILPSVVQILGKSFNGKKSEDILREDEFLGIVLTRLRKYVTDSDGLNDKDFSFLIMGIQFLADSGNLREVKKEEMLENLRDLFFSALKKLKGEYFAKSLSQIPSFIELDNESQLIKIIFGYIEENSTQYKDIAEILDYLKRNRALMICIGEAYIPKLVSLTSISKNNISIYSADILEFILHRKENNWKAYWEKASIGFDFFNYLIDVVSNEGKSYSDSGRINSIAQIMALLESSSDKQKRSIFLDKLYSILQDRKENDNIRINSIAQIMALLESSSDKQKRSIFLDKLYSILQDRKEKGNIKIFIVRYFYSCFESFTEEEKNTLSENFLKIIEDNSTLRKTVLSGLPQDFLTKEKYKNLIVKIINSDKYPLIDRACAIFSTSKLSSERKKCAEKAFSLLKKNFKDSKFTDDPLDAKNVLLITMIESLNKTYEEVDNWKIADFQKAISEMPDDKENMENKNPVPPVQPPVVK